MRHSSTLPLPSLASPLATERFSARVTVKGGPLDSVVTSMRNGLERLPRGSVVLHATFALDDAFANWAWQVGALFATASCVGTPWWDAEYRSLRVLSRFVWPHTEERAVVRVLETAEGDVRRRRMAILLSEDATEAVPAAFPKAAWPSPSVVLEAIRVAAPHPLDWLAAFHTAGIVASRPRAS
ncbi:MAG: hypothetical protein SFW67_27645 [Myxococcaceae bacterium]|nr:hypothetical protein [Myxococcaceae bacterium]